MSRLGLRLTPNGRLIAEAAQDAPEIDAAAAARLEGAFAQGSGAGLLRLGAGEVCLELGLRLREVAALQQLDQVAVRVRLLAHVAPGAVEAGEREPDLGVQGVSGRDQPG